jgi:hypothetical protein
VPPRPGPLPAVTVRFEAPGPDSSPGSVAFSWNGPARPALRVLLASGRRIALFHGEDALLFARVDPAYAGVAVLFAGAVRPAVLPPLGATDARRIRDAPLSAAWWERWARRFVTLLESAPGPLHPGRWTLEPAALVGPKMPLPAGRRPLYAAADGEVNALSPGPLLHESWGINGSGALLPLRSPSDPRSGRVHALRKLARSGTLPPVLALFVTGLDLAVVVDGHDRLHAATLEGVSPPILLLTSIRVLTFPPSPRRELALHEVERALAHAEPPSPATVERVNQRLLWAFAEAYAIGKTRCFPFPGGAAAWDHAVLRLGAQLGVVGAEQLTS